MGIRTRSRGEIKEIGNPRLLLYALLGGGIHVFEALIDVFLKFLGEDPPCLRQGTGYSATSHTHRIGSCPAWIVTR